MSIGVIEELVPVAVARELEAELERMTRMRDVAEREHADCATALWICPGCAFTFDAHHLPTGFKQQAFEEKFSGERQVDWGEVCPCCNESQAEARAENAEAALRKFIVAAEYEVQQRDAGQNRYTTLGLIAALADAKAVLGG